MNRQEALKVATELIGKESLSEPHQRYLVIRLSKFLITTLHQIRDADFVIRKINRKDIELGCTSSEWCHIERRIIVAIQEGILS